MPMRGEAFGLARLACASALHGSRLAARSQWPTGDRVSSIVLRTGLESLNLIAIPKIPTGYKMSFETIHQ